MTAAAGGHIEVMKKLLDLGVAVDTASKGGDTALSNAAWGGYPEAVALLLEHRAPVNSRDVLERTPLDVAVERVNLECAYLLRAASGVEDGSDGE